ncbi:MAG: hypothetical protein M3297_04060 [Thermoproteota archaeon]|nr:hypothetical protein [Thermoproteota archaeon]
MCFWNNDLNDWINRQHLDESISAYTFSISGGYDINSWYDEFQDFRISLNGVRISFQKETY